MQLKHVKPVRYLRRKIAYHPVPVRMLYTEALQGAARIPNRVYQTWKKPMLPLALAVEVRRFRKLNPDYSFSFFDDQQMAEYMSSYYSGHPILKIFKDVWMPAEKVDIWRFCILYREGGIYCDIDSAMTVPLRSLISNDMSELISFEDLQWKDLMFRGRYADANIFLPAPPDSIRSNLDHPDNTVLNWFLCFEKGNPILQEVIDLIVRHSSYYRGKVFDNLSVASNHFTGVVALTQAVWMWMQKSGKRPAQCGINYCRHGVFKLRGMDYRESPHHSSMKNLPLLD